MDGLTSSCCYITFDSTGNLWAIDEAGKVCRFGSDGQVVRTYEGLLSNGYNWGLALDQTYFYLSDVNADKVKKCKQTDGSLVAEVNAAEEKAFNNPTQLAFGPDGNLYLADFSNGRIVVLSPALSVLRTINSTDDDETKSSPLAMAFGPDGCLYIHDRYNDCIKKIGPDDSIILKIPTSSMFVNALAFDDSGTLYITDNTATAPKIHVWSWSAE